MKSRLLLFLIPLFFNCTSSFAQQGTWLWGVLASGSNNTTEGNSVATDANGNSFSTGWFAGKLTVGSYTLNSGVAVNATYLIKYDKNGNVLWAKQSTTPSSVYEGPNPYSQGNCVATDKYGNAYVIGLFQQDSIKFGSFGLASPGYDNGQAMFLVKYNSNGAVMWAKQVNDNLALNYTTLSAGYGVSTDPRGNVYVVGDVTSTGGAGGGNLIATLGTDTLSSYVNYYFIAKYDSAGNVIWAKQPAKFQNGEAITISTDKFGNSYIGGGFLDTSVIGKDTLVDPQTVYGTYSFVAKYDSNGNALWARQGISTYDNDAIIQGIATDYHNGIYITGYFSGQVYFGNFLLSSPELYNIFVAKYDSSGKVIWAKSSTGEPGTSQWQGYSIAADTLDQVFVSCSDDVQAYDEFNFGSGSFQVTDRGGYDGNSIIMELDSGGNFLCGEAIPGGGDDRNCISTSPAANYVNFGGDLEDTVVIGPDTLSPHSGFAELPFMTSWMPCLPYNLEFTNAVNFNCSSNTATAIITSVYRVPHSVTWNTVPVQTGDTATNLLQGTYVATIIVSTIADTLYDTVVVQPAKLTISFNSPTPTVCNGQSVSLVANGATNYTWSPDSGLNINNGDTVIATTLVTTTYIVIGITGSCSATDSVVVTVKSNPSVAVNSPTICSGTSTTLSATGANTYAWFPATALSATTGDSVEANPSATTIYTVIGTSDNCPDTAKAVVTVEIPPPLIILPQPPPVICFNFQSDTLRVASHGSDFIWSPSEGLSATTGVSVIASPSVSVTYTVTGIDSLGCAATGTESVTILQIANTPTFVQHNDTLISSSKNDNQWYRNDTLLLNDTSQYLIISILGNYYVEINNEANGCSTSSDTVDITSLTGINQLTVDNGQLTVYPNPTSSSVFIKINSPVQDAGDWNLQVTDVLGRTLFTMPPLNPLKGTFEIDLSNFAGGIYFISVINKTGREVVPVMKE